MPLFLNWTRSALSALLVGGVSAVIAQPLLLDPAALNAAPRVVGSVDHRLLMGPGDTVEVRGPHTERLQIGERYRLVSWRANKPTNTTTPPGPLWVQALAHARAERMHTLDPETAAAWLRIEDASDAVRIGDWVWWWPEDGVAP